MPESSSLSISLPSIRRVTKNFLKVVGDGECELRQIFEPSDQGTCGPDLKELAKT
jgi:hypothetical protein